MRRSRTHHLYFFDCIRLDGNALHTKHPPQSVLRPSSRPDKRVGNNSEATVDPRCDATERDRGLQFTPRGDTSVVSGRQRRFEHELWGGG
jgi:hypothetical protein